MQRLKIFMRVSLGLVALIGMAFHFASTSALAQDTRYKVAVVTHGAAADPFWKPVRRGVSDAAQLYADLEVTYRGTSVYSLEEFLGNVEAAIASKPDALVCTLTAPEQMDAMLRKVIEAGLPVVAINAQDLRMPQSERIPVLTYIGEDSSLVGEIAAKETLKRFTPKRALFCNHQPGAANIEARGRGWIDYMTKNGVAAEMLDVGSDAEQAADVIVAYLQEQPEIDALFISNIGITPVLIRRLEAQGVDVGSSLHIAQMDVSSEVLEYIRDGNVMFTLDQQPYLQGYLGVVFAYLHVKFGFTPPPTPVSTGPAIVTDADINPTRSY